MIKIANLYLNSFSTHKLEVEGMQGGEVMLGYWGEITQISDESKQIQFLQVYVTALGKSIPAIYYVTYGQRCQVGDWVKVNISALELGLGTGGYGFVMARCCSSQVIEEDTASSYPGHIIKLRYTPWQTPVLACEAPESEYHAFFTEPFDLKGKYIILGELHSMLPVLVSLLHSWEPERKIVYLMDDQAALYSSFSHHVRYLQKKHQLTVITFGQSLGGDLETVNIYTALEAAYKIVKADDIIITQGPGVVGTRTIRGFSGMQLTNWLHAVHTCGGHSLVIPRIQFTDQRAHHYGISQHTLYPLAYHALAPVTFPIPAHSELGTREERLLLQQSRCLQELHEVVPIPRPLFQNQLEVALANFGQPITTMGKSYREEPYFYYAIGACFHLYKQRVSSL